MDVVSIRLERSNGDTVQALPTSQRVDFADLSEVTEFTTAATIPNGNYVAATVRLDYTDAEVSVEVAGMPAEARVVDENGAALGVVDIELELDAANQVAIASGTPALLLLAFDIVATHELNILTIPATATTDPAPRRLRRAAGRAGVPRARPARLRGRGGRQLRRGSAPLQSPERASTADFTVETTVDDHV